LNGEPVELYNIETDILEQQNLLEEKSDIVESLRKELELWLKEPRRQFGEMANI